MNDRFRFRAWHKPTKKMFEVFCFTDKEVFENTFDGVGTSQTNPANIDDCALMQSTGLKDKNGKLIYEGDIVRYTRYALRGLEEEFTYKGIIRWELYEFNIKNWEDEKEVIGNIHENPELLKSVTNCNQSEVDK